MSMAGRVAALAGVLGVAAATGPSFVDLQAQAPAKTVWDGVYTEAQAARGRSAYQQHCAECHGGSLEGARRLVRGWAAPPSGGCAAPSLVF